MSLFAEESALRGYHRAMDEQRIADDAQDAAMVQRWETFIDTARMGYRELGSEWAAVVASVALALNPTRVLDEDDLFLAAVRSYIDSDGLPMCLRAIAQAMDAEAIDRAETERRR